MSLRIPKPIGSPVLESVLPVVERSRDVRTNLEKIVEHAGWMAYEDFPAPQFVLPFGIGADPDLAMDFTLVANTMNFAFTEFSTGVKFETDFLGRRWSDSEALFACMKRALDNGVPILDGKFLARIHRDDVERIFEGNIELPLLKERAVVLREVGGVLVQRYGGRFANFVKAGPPLAYANGNGLLERMIAEFPRFNDASPYDGFTVQVQKLAQLGLWLLHCTLNSTGAFRLEDLGRLTAFADYIVPVALRVMGIFEYSPALEEAIQSGQIVQRDSPQEVEIRAHTIYATALLCEEINRRRPAEKQLVIPQVDARLWTHYHATHWPHHLTKTIMY